MGGQSELEGRSEGIIQNVVQRQRVGQNVRRHGVVEEGEAVRPLDMSSRRLAGPPGPQLTGQLLELGQQTDPRPLAGVGLLHPWMGPG